MLNREIIILTDSFSERKRIGKSIFPFFIPPGEGNQLLTCFLKISRKPFVTPFQGKNLVDQRGLYTNKYLEAFNGNYPEAEV